MKRLALILALFAIVAVPARAQRASDPACDPSTPAAMQLSGLPTVAVIGQSYTVALVPTGAGTATGRYGSTLGVSDRKGRGWSAHYEYLSGVEQAFSVGIDGAPFTVSGSYSEVLAGGGTCTRTLTAPLPIERRILAVVNCHRGVLEPRSGLVLRCDGNRLRLRDLRWRGWNGDTTTGHGRVRGHAVTVTLSRPVECSQLNAFIYSRARVSGIAKRIPIYCPLPDQYRSRLQAAGVPMVAVTACGPGTACVRAAWARAGSPCSYTGRWHPCWTR
jgi:hypothetical protein